MEEKRDHKIYKYTNKVNGKVYIGRTCRSLKKRAGAKGIQYQKCTHFWRAIQKYGWENFEGEIIEEGLDDKEATERELFWMNQYQSTDRYKGYNISDSCNYISNELRRARSETMSGSNNPMWHFKYTSEQIERRRQASLGEKNPFYGRHHTEETKKRISEVKKEYFKTHNGNRLGHKASKETREKLSRSKKGKYCGKDSHRYGIKHTEEAKRKMSEHKKGREAWNKIRVKCAETGEIFESAAKACRITAIDNSGILKCCKNLSKTCGGYHWEYADKSN